MLSLLIIVRILFTQVRQVGYSLPSSVPQHILCQIIQALFLYNSFFFADFKYVTF